MLDGGDLQVVCGRLPPVFGRQRGFADLFAQHVGKLFDLGDLLILDGPLDVGFGVEIRPVAVAAHLVGHADPIAVEFRFQGESFFLAFHDQGIGVDAAHLRRYPDLLRRQALEEILEDHAEKIVGVGLVAAPGPVEILDVRELYVLGEDRGIFALAVEERVLVGNGAVLADCVDVKGKSYGHAFLVGVPREGDVVPFALFPTADVGSGHSFAVGGKVGEAEHVFRAFYEAEAVLGGAYGHNCVLFAVVAVPGGLHPEANVAVGRVQKRGRKLLFTCWERVGGENAHGKYQQKQEGFFHVLSLLLVVISDFNS